MKQSGFLTIGVESYNRSDIRFAHTYLAFGKARLAASLNDIDVTHVVVGKDDLSRLSQIRSTLSRLHLTRFLD